MSEANAPKVLKVDVGDDISVRFSMRTRPQKRWFRRYLDGSLHEPVLTKHILDTLSPGDTFIDVGAHLGWFSVLAAARGARVYAFEMQTGLIPLIHESVALNGYDEMVTVVPAGLGSQCGILPYRRESLSATKGLSVAPGEDVYHTACLTLDAALEGLEPTLIKLDVEGFEGKVLAGAKSLLANQRPSIIMELHEAVSQFGDSIPEVLGGLHELGYRVDLYDSHRSETSDRRTLTPDQFHAPKKNSLVVAEPRAPSEAG